MRILRIFFVMTALAACQAEPDAAPDVAEGGRKIDMLVPATLAEGGVELNDPEAVAAAIGVKLSGDPNQTLYEITMTAPNADRRMVTRVIAVRVDNVAQGSAMIRSMQNMPPVPAGKYAAHTHGAGL